MRFTVIALLGLAGAVKINKGYDASDPLGRNVAKDQHGEMHLSGYNGADEDEIMDNIFSRYSKEGRTPSGHKTGQKLLMKDEAKLAAGQAEFQNLCWHWTCSHTATTGSFEEHRSS